MADAMPAPLSEKSQQRPCDLDVNKLTPDAQQNNVSDSEADLEGDTRVGHTPYGRENYADYQSSVDYQQNSMGDHEGSLARWTSQRETTPLLAPGVSPEVQYSSNFWSGQRTVPQLTPTSPPCGLFGELDILHKEAKRRAQSTTGKPSFPWQGRRIMPLEEIHVSMTLVDRDSIAKSLPTALANQKRHEFILGNAMQSDDAMTNIASFFDANICRYEHYTPTQETNQHACHSQESISAEVYPASSVMQPEERISFLESDPGQDRILASKEGHLGQPPPPTAIRVGVYGAGSVGKSHLCYHLLINWANERHLTSFPVVLMWHLRDEETQQAKNLAELLQAVGLSECLSKEMSPALENGRGRGCLFVLDGLDELESQNKQYVRRLMEGKVLPEACLLVTSRACSKADQLFASYAARTEILGFNDEQAEEFIQTQIPAQEMQDDGDSMLVDKMIRLRSEHPHLAALTQSPLMASVICEVLRQDRELPHTRAELYEQIILASLKNAVEQGRLDIPLCDVDCTTVDQLGTQAKNILQQLATLACNTFATNQVIFSSSTLSENHCSEEENPRVFALGLLVTILGRLGQHWTHPVRRYAFMFLTIQEYLTAYSQTRNLVDEQPACPVHWHVVKEEASKQSGNGGVQPALSSSSGRQLSLTRRLLHKANPREKITSVTTTAKRVLAAWTGQRQSQCPLDALLEEIPMKRRNYLVWQFIAGIIPQHYNRCLAATLNKAMLSCHPRRHAAMQIQACICIWECCNRRNGHYQPPDNFELKSEFALSRQPLVLYDIQAVCHAIRGSSIIKAMYITHCHLTLPLAIHLSNVLTSLSTLRELWVPDNRIGDAGFVEIMQALLVHDVIEIIDASDNDLTKVCCEQVAPALARNRSLKRLDLLHNARLGDEGILEILQSWSWQPNPAINELGLRGTAMGDESCKRLALLIANQETRICTLRLSNNCITAQGAAALSQALTRNQTVRTLKLDGNNLSNEGVQSLAMALETNDSLTKLFISNTAFSESAAAEVAEALKKNRTLTDLDMHDNFIGTEAGQQLALSAVQHPQLSDIDMSYNQISEAGVLHIQGQYRQHKPTAMLTIQPQFARNGLQCIAVE